MKIEMGENMCDCAYVRSHIYVWMCAYFLVLCSMRNEEIQSLSGVDEFGEFYRRLKQLKDYHRKFADDVRCNTGIEVYFTCFIL